MQVRFVSNMNGTSTTKHSSHTTAHTAINSADLKLEVIETQMEVEICAKIESEKLK